MIITDLQTQLLPLLTGAQEVWIAVALMTDNGYGQIREVLQNTPQHYLIGVNLPTTPTVLRQLQAQLRAQTFEARIAGNRPVFHPKVYIVKKEGVLSAIVGSANLTEPGLQGNHEISYHITTPEHCQQLLDWFQGLYDTAWPLSDENIAEYTNGYIPGDERTGIPARPRPFHFTRPDADESFFENLDLSQHFFRQEHYLAFRNTLQKESTPAADAQRIAVRDKFLELHNILFPRLHAHANLRELDCHGSEKNIVSLPIHNSYTNEELNAMWFPIIIVDECQDLSKGQLEILESLRAQGAALHFVGDMNQSIYEFRKVDPQDTQDYIQKNAFVKLRLTNNYRSCQSIVSICENIVQNPQPITGHHPQTLPIPCQLWEYDDASYSQLPARFSELLSVNQIPSKKAVILARGKSTLKPFRHQHSSAITSKLEMAALALYNWHKPNRSTDELKSALSYAGKVLCFLGCSGRGDPHNQFCPEGMAAVQWRLTLKSFLEEASDLFPFTQNGQDLNWSQWANKFKQHLAPHWAGIPGVQSGWDDVKTKIRAPQNKGNALVKDICSEDNHQNTFRTTTIHGVKGETVEAVLLVSSQDARSKGGFYQQWFKDGNFDPEYIRFAYVACSRPRSLLIIATPRLSAVNKQKLEAWGLIFV